MVYMYIHVLILFGGRHERKYVGMPDGSVAGDVSRVTCDA